MKELRVLENEIATCQKTGVQSLNASGKLSTEVVTDTLRSLELKLAVIDKPRPRIDEMSHVVKVLGASDLSRRIETIDIRVVR